MQNPNEIKLNKIQEEAEKEKKLIEKFSPIDFEDLMSMEFNTPDWLVESLIQADGTNLLSGLSRSYKTWFALLLAIQVSKGELFLDQFKVIKTRVLIIDEENHKRILQKRLRALNTNDQSLPDIFILSNKQVLYTETEQIIGLCKKLGVGLVIIDSLVRIHNKNENEAGDMAEVFRRLKELNEAETTVLITHHNRKSSNETDPSQSVRGSSDILNAVDVNIASTRKGNENAFTITQTKSRLDEEIKPFVIEVIKDKETGKVRMIYKGIKKDEKEIKIETTTNFIKKLLSDLPSINQKTIIEKAEEKGITKNQIVNLLKSAVASGEIIFAKSKGNEKLYSLPT